MKVRSIAGVFVFAVCGVSAAQVVHPVDPMPSFDVATIKPAPEPPRSYTPQGANAARYPYSTALDLVSLAYGITSDRKNRIIGGPGWASSDHYGIEARIDEELAKKMQAMPPEKSREERSLLLQSLLAERFKLKVHFETKVLPQYELVQGKNGTKLKEAAPATPAKVAPGPIRFTPNMTKEQVLSQLPNGGMMMMSGRDGMTIYGKSMKLDALGNMLAGQVGNRTVLNHTGLTGVYDVALNWAPDSGAGIATINGASANPSPSFSDSPDIFTAVQEQLGLKLVPTKGEMEIVVIDHIEQPTDN